MTAGIYAIIVKDVIRQKNSNAIILHMGNIDMTMMFGINANIKTGLHYVYWRRANNDRSVYAPAKKRFMCVYTL